VNARVGTSGFAYDFWRGSFYPEELDEAHMLAFYARSFSTVEINNTFYRIPKAAVVEKWASSVPASFRFVIKASRRITHQARLEGCQDSIEYMVGQLAPLGEKLGAVLFQCAPTLRFDLPRLRGFLAMWPKDLRAALEFRHSSWFCADTYACLQDHGVAMCIGDYEGEGVVPGGATPFEKTASFGYVRLRDEGYEDAALQAWAVRIAATFPEAYVFFKHEETAPELVERMNSALEAVT